MTTDNWINLIAAILVGGGTLALAFMTWKSIRQTRSIQKAEKRERLLNEIIEWAEDIADNAALGHRGVPSKLSADTKMTDYLHDLFHRYHKALVRSEQMKEIASSFGGELYSSFVKVDRMTLDTSKILIEYGKRKVTTEKLEHSETQLCETAVNLIKEATKLKTKDIEQNERNMSKEDEATGSNAPTLKDIEEHLKRQDRQMAGTQWQWLFSLGVSVMAVGLTWFIATTTQGVRDFNGLFIFFAGLLISLLSLFYRYHKKS